MMRLKFVCLNIWLGGKLFDEMIDFLRQEDADVLLLQEVFDGHDQVPERRFRSMGAIQAQLQYPYQDFSRNFQQQLPFGAIPRGNAILSKLPIVDRKSHCLHGVDGTFEDIPENFNTWRHNLQQVVLDTGQSELNVYNFHGIRDLNGERDSPERLAMSRRIVDTIKDEARVVLAGDTNVSPNTQTIRAVEEHLTNVYKDELTTSFNLSRKDLNKFPGYATAVVDMAFISHDLRVVEHSCPKVDISDHLPLVFTLEVT